MSIQQRLSKLENEKAGGQITIEVNHTFSDQEEKRALRGYVHQKLYGCKIGEPKLIHVSQALTELQEKYPEFPHGVPEDELNQILKG